MDPKLKYGALEKTASVWSAVNPTLPKSRLTKNNYAKILGPGVCPSTQAVYYELEQKRRGKKKKPETKASRMAKKAKALKKPLGPRASAQVPKPKASSLRGKKIKQWLGTFLAKPVGPAPKKTKKNQAATVIQAAYRGKKARNRARRLAAARR